MAADAGRKPTATKASDSGGIARRLPRLAFVLLLALAYRQLQAPPPKIPGTPGGPPVTSPRVKLQDGRHLAYYESGVPREEAKHKIIFVHGFDSCRYDVLRVSPELAQELGIYLLSFDRPGYGESDPHPARTEKSIALDIEQLADALELGPKFYLTGFSMAARSCGAASSTSRTGSRGLPSLAPWATSGGPGSRRT